MAINPFGLAEQQAEPKIVQDATKHNFQPTFNKQPTTQLDDSYTHKSR